MQYDEMPSFEVVLQGRGVELLEGADAYQQEGPMTTFFRCGRGRDVIDSWSTRVASFRTNDIVAIRRREASESPQQLHLTHALAS